MKSLVAKGSETSLKSKFLWTISFYFGTQHGFMKDTCQFSVYFLTYKFKYKV